MSFEPTFAAGGSVVVGTLGDGGGTVNKGYCTRAGVGIFFGASNKVLKSRCWFESALLPGKGCWW